MALSVKTGDFGGSTGGGLDNFEKVGTFNFPATSLNRNNLICENAKIEAPNSYLLVLSVKGTVTAGINYDTILSLSTNFIVSSVTTTMAGIGTILTNINGNTTRETVNASITINPTEKTITVKYTNDYFNKSNAYEVEIFKIT